MDNYYDTDSAYKSLEQRASSDPKGEDRRLVGLVKTPDWVRHVQVAHFDFPQTWRLLGAGIDGEAMEELVFTISGILSEIDLPPITEKPTIAVKQFKFLRQGITITGLGSPTFNTAVGLTQDIYEVFQREFAEGKLEEWSISQQSKPVLSFSNRYFTPKRDSPNMTHVPFDTSVDPRGYLEAMTKHGYVHGDENVVEYYTQERTEANSPSFSKTKPQVFRVGDLVDVQVSFVVVPLKQQKFKMVSVLHSIALVDGTYRQMAARKRQTSGSARGNSGPISLKRRVGYESSQKEKKSQMQLDLD